MEKGESQADHSAFLKILQSLSQGIQVSPELPEMSKGGWMGCGDQDLVPA